MSSIAISMPFFVEMPNVAVVPVSEPNSPMRISEFESVLAPVHDVHARTKDKPKRNNHGLRLMKPPSGRIPEGLVILPIMVSCSYFPGLDHGRARRLLCPGRVWFSDPPGEFASAALLELSSRNPRLSSFAGSVAPLT